MITISAYEIMFVFLLSFFVQLVHSAPDPLDELTINVNFGGNIKDGADTNVYCGVKKKGTQSTARIIGGNEAEVNSYPWMVRMLNKGDPWCGGSVIADKWILTAAHCMIPIVVEEVEDLDVIIGEHDITTTTESQITKLVKPDLIILHPDYVLKTVPDIALLRIPPLDLHTYTPICLPSQGDDYTGKNAWVYGWGITQWKGDLSDVLLEVEIPVWSDTEAEKAWGGGKLPDEKLAVWLFAGGEVGENSCKGDSGGPLSYSNPNNNGRHEQIGIVSFGDYGCATEIPAVYTEVSALIPWIYEKIASNGGATFGRA